MNSKSTLAAIPAIIGGLAVLATALVIAAYFQK